MEDNAIIRRLQTLQALWSEFRAAPESRFCRWLVPQDELSMIDTFYQYNSAEESETPDIFIRFETPFIDAQQYSRQLSEELSSLVEADREDLAEDGIDIPWTSNNIDDPKNTAIDFLKNFFRLADSLGLDEEDFVVAFLSPIEIRRPSEWTKWWTDATELHLPNRIRLMATDTEGYETLDKIAARQPVKMTTLRPKLNMPGAIRELMNEYGDQEDKTTHFRKAFYELTQSVGKRDVAEIRQNAGKALALAREIEYPQLEVAVLCTAATGFSAAGQLGAANKTYDEAAHIAKAAESKPFVKEEPELKVDLPGGNLFEQLGVQVLFFKASGFIGAQPPQYEAAFEVYRQAETQLDAMILKKGDPQQADWMNGGILFLHRIEALRMCGHCLEKMNRSREALTIYTKALMLVDRLDLETRKTTTANFIGQAMLEIYKKLALKQEYFNILDKMNALLGQDWEETLPKKAA